MEGKEEEKEAHTERQRKQISFFKDRLGKSLNNRLSNSERKMVDQLLEENKEL